MSNDSLWPVVQHEPVGYECPFCRLVRGETTKLSNQDDVVLRTSVVLGFIGGEWWPNNPGSVILVPTRHTENLYSVSAAELYSISVATRLIAAAMKCAYQCPGVSTRQHNEPAGGQDVWHFHQHVLPRYEGDLLYARSEERTPVPAGQRASYASKLVEVINLLGAG